MNKRFPVLALSGENISRAGLLLCGILFFCGTIAGTITAGVINDGTKLGTYFSSYMTFFLTGNTVKRDFFSAVFDAYKYNILSLALGFSVVGVFFIPVLSALRGFFLTFSISTVVRVLGGNGILLALAIFGLNTLFTIPCFLILSTDAFSASQYIMRQTVLRNQKTMTSPLNRHFFSRCGLCFFMLTITALIDLFITPQLIALAASRI